MKRTFNCFATAMATFSLLVIVPFSFAQSTSPDAAQLLQNLSKTTIISGFGNSPTILQDLQVRKRVAPPTSGVAPTINIQGFTVSGLAERPKFDVRKLLASHIGNDRTFDQIEMAAEALQIALRQEGFFLAQVDIPQQAIKSGVIELRVIQGYLDEVEIKPLPVGVRADKTFIAKLLGSHLQQGQVLTVASLERTLYLISDLSGVRVESVIEPGSKPGTARLVVSITPTAQTDQSVDFDNYGSRFTGEYRVNASMSFNAPYLRGDQLKLTGMTTTNGGTKFARVAYQTPVGASGLKVGVALSSLSYKLGTSTFTPLVASGDGGSATLFALYPAIRSRNLNIFLQGNLDRRGGEDKQEAVGVDNKSHATVTSVSLVGDARDSLGGGGISNFNTGIVSGKLSLDTPSLLAADQAATGRQSNGYYSKFTYGLARQQHLWVDATQPSNRMVLFASIQGQMASKNLSSGEKMSLGGPTAVRAYAGGEGVGDNARVFTWELRKSVLGEHVNGDLVFTVFGDYGYSLVNKTALSTDTTRSIYMAGHGVGLNWAHTNGFLLRLSIAQRTGAFKPTGDTEDRLPRIYFSLSKPL